MTQKLEKKKRKKKLTKEQETKKAQKISVKIKTKDEMQNFQKQTKEITNGIGLGKINNSSLNKTVRKL